MTWAIVLLALVGRVVFTFVDPAITESSGLVDLGDVMVTTNDSGGDPLVFVVDPQTGRTVGHATYTDHVVDTEALAPAGGHDVWVGDIGDNAERRDSVRVYRVPVARGDHRVDAPSYELVYPDGAHDAESLLYARGRLWVITKALLGGTVYVAPRQLSSQGPNRLRPVAGVDVWATDAALFPDGRHVLVRGYDGAVVYTFPGFRPVASVELPRQRQGEGVSIGASGRIRLSSEGRNSPVLEVSLPASVTAAMSGATGTPSPSAAASSASSGSSSPGRDRPAGGHGWLLGVAGTTGAAGLALLALLLRRPRRRGGRIDDMEARR
jgi:hypothetical protein